MSVLEIVLYSVISLIVLIYVIKSIRDIVKGKKKKEPTNADDDEKD